MKEWAICRRKRMKNFRNFEWRVSKINLITLPSTLKLTQSQTKSLQSSDKKRTLDLKEMWQRDCIKKPRSASTNNLTRESQCTSTWIETAPSNLTYQRHLTISLRSLICSMETWKTSMKDSRPFYKNSKKRGLSISRSILKRLSAPLNQRLMWPLRS